MLIYGCKDNKSKVLTDSERAKYDSLVYIADSLYKSKDYVKSLESYKIAFEINQQEGFDLYNGACSASLANDKDYAFFLLDLALKDRFQNLNHIKSDTDLANLRSSKKWDEHIEKMTAQLKELESKYNVPLRNELLKISEDDQKFRIGLADIAEKYHNTNNSYKVDSVVNLMNKMDASNLRKIVAILDKYGWVGNSKIGEDAGTAIFLVIQHSDLETQIKYLPMMREAVRKGEALANQLALLEDRTALRLGKKQIYGSQIYSEENGKNYLAPLINPDSVDIRRKSVGLNPLTYYLKSFGIKWDVKQYKKDLPEIEKRAKLYEQ